MQNAEWRNLRRFAGQSGVLHVAGAEFEAFET